MDKPRIRWSNEHGRWLVSAPFITTALGYHKWEDAVAYALSVADVLGIFHRPTRVIGWAADASL